MRRMLVFAMLSVALLSSAVFGQSEPVLTPVDFEKLKLRTLDEQRVNQLPPVTRKALGLPEQTRLDFKQLAAGDATQQYFFMVRVNSSADDIFVSIRNEEGMRIYLTNAKLQYRGGAYSSKLEPVRLIPSGDPKAAAEFQEILKVWAEVAQSL